MEATKFRRAIWQDRDILVFITKWVVLNNWVLNNRFPDERLLDVLKCVSKFHRDFIDEDLRVLLRKSYDYLDSIKPTRFDIFNLIFRYSEDEGVQASLTTDINHVYGAYSVTHCDTVIGLDATYRLYLNLKDGYTAYLLEFHQGLKKDLNFLPFDLNKYAIKRFVGKKLDREMLHGEIMFIFDNQAKEMKLAVLFKTVETHDNPEEMLLSVTAIGMCLLPVEEGFRWFDNYEVNLNSLKNSSLITY